MSEKVDQTSMVASTKVFIGGTGERESAQAGAANDG
jgi:hypothetical protein